MNEVCPTCGLPKELCVCEAIAKETQKIEVVLERKTFGKKYTIIRGLEAKEIDIKDLAKKLKERFACGGTVKDNTIELQGDHRPRVKQALVALGFPPEIIIVK